MITLRTDNVCFNKAHTFSCAAAPQWLLCVPLMDWRLGRMVTAPSAISSWCTTGEIFEPQLSEPTQMK